MSVQWTNQWGQPISTPLYTAANSGNASRRPNYRSYPGTGLQPGAQWQQQQYQSGLNNMTQRMGALSFGHRGRKRKTRKGRKNRKANTRKN